jgi:hypothetical protein
MVSTVGGGSVRVSGLELETGILIGHALTLDLDRHHYRDMYTHSSYPFEQARQEAIERAEIDDRNVFGVTRPANANFGVKVYRQSSNGQYELKADIRNKFEDKPELGGRMLLQLSFIAVIEALNLNS